jgi:hypothetical protein
MASITKARALDIARKECELKGWPWNEKTTVKWGLFTYLVWGGGRKGGNLVMRIRKKDGAILSSDLTPM